jgi:hypothetical protein
MNGYADVIYSEIFSLVRTNNTITPIEFPLSIDGSTVKCTFGFSYPGARTDQFVDRLKTFLADVPSLKWTINHYAWDVSLLEDKFLKPVLMRSIPNDDAGRKYLRRASKEDVVRSPYLFANNVMALRLAVGQTRFVSNRMIQLMAYYVRNFKGELHIQRYRQQTVDHYYETMSLKRCYLLLDLATMLESYRDLRMDQAFEEVALFLLKDPMNNAGELKSFLGPYIQSGGCLSRTGSFRE